MDIRVYVLIGSEPGNCDLQVARDAGAPTIATGRTANLESRGVILRVQADLRDLAPGRYIIGTRKEMFRWMYYPVSVAE